MRPAGLVYKFGWKPAGTRKISLSSLEKAFFKLARITGACMFSLSLSALILYYGPLLRSQASSGFIPVNSQEEDNIAAVVETKSAKDDRQIEVAKTKEVTQFSISIPAISASSEIIKNVNPFDELDYLSSLKEGVAHASGTGFPGEGRRIYLFAHSTNSPFNFTKYNAVFYQLKKLEKNNLILVSINDKEYKYAVKRKLIVEATDTHWITEETNQEELVLQTCDPPGTTLKRLLVFAEPI